MKLRLHGSLSLVVLLVLSLGSLHAQRNPRYVLSLDGPCGETIVGPPADSYDDGTGGEPYFLDLNAYFGDADGNGHPDRRRVSRNRPGHTWDVILTTTENPTDFLGACYWRFSLAVDGPLRITDITTDGTAGCRIDWLFPECRRFPGGFEYLELTGPPGGTGPQTEENLGAICGVLLKSDCVITLPVEGSETVLKIRVFAEFPPNEGDVVDARVYFTTRVGSAGVPFSPQVYGPGGPVDFVEGDPLLTVQDCSFRLKASSVAAFVRCDVNADARLEVSDAVWIVNELFLGSTSTRCGPAADCNADGNRDISDGIYALGYLFTGGRPPPAPFPACERLDLSVEDCPPGSTACP